MDACASCAFVVGICANVTGLCMASIWTHQTVCRLSGCGRQILNSLASIDWAITLVWHLC